jgi:CMP-N-acetylneuraminic acid synthetase
MTKKVVALVPVKLDSQRIPHKNKLSLGGRPLCWHMCNTLLEAGGIDEVCVYCSSPDVVSLLPEGTRWVKRPAWLDGAEIKGAQIYSEFISKVDADVYVLAHTTSPFLRVESVREGLHAILEEDCDSAFTAQRIQTFAWFGDSPLNYNFDDVPRTQDIEPVWIETSGFYMFCRELFVNEGRRIGHRPRIIEANHFEAIDIDEPQDFSYAQLVAEYMWGEVLLVYESIFHSRNPKCTYNMAVVA